MEAIMQTLNTEQTSLWTSNRATTTLYELIASINEEIPPNKDWLVVDIVLDLLKTGKIRFLESMDESAPSTSFMH